jgi:hypothetical protein
MFIPEMITVANSMAARLEKAKYFTGRKGLFSCFGAVFLFKFMFTFILDYQVFIEEPSAAPSGTGNH